MEFSFSKEKRLLKNQDFRTVLGRRICVSDGLLKLYIARNDLAIARLGISVGKSCGKAVVRNRLKRLVREAFRQNPKNIPTGFDYVVMISPKWLKDADNVKKAALESGFSIHEDIAFFSCDYTFIR